MLVIRSSEIFSLTSQVEDLRENCRVWTEVFNQTGSRLWKRLVSDDEAVKVTLHQPEPV